jgi:hypothetical protein
MTSWVIIGRVLVTGSIEAKVEFFQLVCAIFSESFIASSIVLLLDAMATWVAISHMRNGDVVSLLLLPGNQANGEDALISSLTDFRDSQNPSTRGIQSLLRIHCIPFTDLR